MLCAHGRVWGKHIQICLRLSADRIVLRLGRHKDTEQGASLLLLCCPLWSFLAAEQTKNFLSFNLFAFRRGVRGEPEKIGRKFLGLHARVRERVRGAFQCNRSVLYRFKPPRTRSVRSQPFRDWKWVRAKVSMSAPKREIPRKKSLLNFRKVFQ